MKKILVLYDPHWLPIKTIAHYLECFQRYSRHQVYYASSLDRCPFALDYFDALVIHFSVKVCYRGYLSRSYQKALRRFQGLKVLFVQDEYEASAANCQAIEDLGIRIVFTCVPPDSISKVFPPERFSRPVLFENVLTGYAPLDLADQASPNPIRERPIVIGYRGRRLGYWYGDLGREKLIIGQRMKELCDARGLVTDIAWEENDRIYGEGWFRFLARSKATLGSESGANVFDADGSIANRIQREVYRNPNISYEEIHAKYLSDLEGRIMMNQISPKLFEAIACKTALVLFEGEYSDILKPHRHFIPLKKDFSNVEDVFAGLADDGLLQTMVDRTYADIIAGGCYGYRRFVDRFDSVLEGHWPAAGEPGLAESLLPAPPCDAVLGYRRRQRLAPARSWLASSMKAGLRPLLNRARLKRIYVMLPGFMRRFLTPATVRLREEIKQRS